MDYQVLRLLHLLSVSIFVGSLVCIHALKLLSDRLGPGQQIIVACRFIDKFFLPPAAVILTITGLALWWLTRSRTDHEWLVLLLLIWLFTACIGIGYLAPQLRWLMEQRVFENTLEYKKRNKIWNRVNLISVIVILLLYCIVILRDELFINYLP